MADVNVVRHSMLYMLDTNISSGLMKGRLPGIESRLKVLGTERWCISAVTRMEHRCGVERAQSPRIASAVERYLELAPVASWDAKAADELGWLRVALKRAGTPIGGVYDEMIAAHALALRAVLVTRDGGFRHVPGLEVESWSEPGQATALPES